ncbi:MAG: DUF4333 domain-containing protein [Aquihabitans sp.]
MGSKVVRQGLVAVGIGAALLLSACSSTGTQVSDEISSQLKDKLDLSSEPKVSCPDDAEAGKGETFTCDIELDGGTVPVRVTFEDDTNFTTKVDGAVYKKTKLDSALKADLDKNGLTLEKLDCEGGTFVVFKAKDTVTCTATVAAGTEWPVVVGLDADRNAVVEGTLYEKTAVEDFVTQQLASQVDLSSVDCDQDDLLQAQEDTSIECQAEATDGSTATVEVSLAKDGTATVTDVTEN